MRKTARLALLVPALATVGALSLATPAEAGTSKVTAGHAVECGKAVLAFANPMKYPVTFAYEVDGGKSQYVTLTEGSKTVPLSFGEDSGGHGIRYRVAKSPESDDRTDWTVVKVRTDCLKDVTPHRPHAKDATCKHRYGAIVIKPTKGVWYKVDGKPVKGWYVKVRPGGHKVTAHPRKGYELADGAKSKWRLKVHRPEHCTTPSPDPTEPTDKPTDKPTKEPTHSPTTPPANGGTGGGDQNGGGLPVTGASLPWLAGGGLGLLASGGGALWLARRRLAA